MIPIHTVVIRRRWFCFSTFDNQDFSYTGKTMEEAQNKMKARLIKSDLLEHACWDRVESIQPPDESTKQEEPLIGYANNRIDNL